MKYLFFFLAPLFICCSVNNAEKPISNISLVNNNPYEIVLLKLINKHRKNKNLNELQILEEIKQDTDLHTDYMIKAKKISHYNFRKRATEITDKTKARKIAENVAVGSSSPESIFKNWINSKYHRENIEGDFTHFNLSAKKDSKNNWYCTNIFVKIP